MKKPFRFNFLKTTSALAAFLLSTSAFAGESEIARILLSDVGSRIVQSESWRAFSERLVGRVVSSPAQIRRLERELTAAEGRFRNIAPELEARLRTLETAARSLEGDAFRARMESELETRSNADGIEFVAARETSATLAQATQRFTSAAPRPAIVPSRGASQVDFVMPGMQVASVQDATGSTGATLFYFPNGAHAVYDARGGSVASAETHLLNPGSYSNEVDGIVFAGGSTMGLAASSGVRDAIFAARAGEAGAFDMIPSVPSAVVYDFGGRVDPTNHPLVYPTAEMGIEMMNHLGTSFQVGRAGAGISTTANKMNAADGVIFGGQGAMYQRFSFGNIFAAVIVNPVGDIFEGGSSISDSLRNIRGNASSGGPRPGRNTTLSILITDAPLDRNQLQRLATMVHTSMAETIRPFHTYHDGDIHFAVSTAQEGTPVLAEGAEWQLEMEARRMMREAIVNSVRAANGAPLPVAATRPRRRR